MTNSEMTPDTQPLNENEVAMVKDAMSNAAFDDQPVTADAIEHALDINDAYAAQHQRVAALESQLAARDAECAAMRAKIDKAAERFLELAAGINSPSREDWQHEAAEMLDALDDSEQSAADFRARVEREFAERVVAAIRDRADSQYVAASRRCTGNPLLTGEEIKASRGELTIEHLKAHKEVASQLGRHFEGHYIIEMIRATAPPAPEPGMPGWLDEREVNIVKREITP